MYNLVSISKYKDETISIIQDFSDVLKSGEVVSTATFYITVLTGVDTNPTNILYQTYIPTGTRVDQKFRLGVPGVIYEVVFQVLGTLGSVVEKTTSLAILPTAGNAIPQFTFIYLTSYIYPYIFSEGIIPALLPRKAYEIGNIIEGISHSMSPSMGSLFGSSTTYNIPPEGIANVMLPYSGSIYGSSISYAGVVEQITNSCAPTLGSIYGSSISYSIPTESISNGMLPASGTII